MRIRIAIVSVVYAKYLTKTLSMMCIGFEFFTQTFESEISQASESTHYAESDFSFLATSMTNRAEVFPSVLFYAGIHKVRILVFDNNYQKCNLPLTHIGVGFNQ